MSLEVYKTNVISSKLLKSLIFLIRFEACFYSFKLVFRFLTFFRLLKLLKLFNFFSLSRLVQALRVLKLYYYLLRLLRLTTPWVSKGAQMKQKNTNWLKSLAIFSTKYLSSYSSPCLNFTETYLLHANMFFLHWSSQFGH